MADVKISQLPAASVPLSGTEIFPLVQNNVTVQTQVSSINSAVTFNVDTFTGTGTQTLFNLATSPTRLTSTSVYINGVYQQKNTYSLSGLSLTFSEAPPFTSLIEVTYI